MSRIGTTCWRSWQLAKRITGFGLAGLRRVGALPGLRWLLDWTDPLTISRRLLRRALQKRASYARGTVLDVGCGAKPYRDLFPCVEKYIGLDLPGTPGVDIEGTALDLPLPDASVDTVLSTQVLEHVPEPARLFQEAARVLRPQGVLVLTTPQTWGLHLEPHDYYRFTKYGLRHLAESSGLEVIEAGPICGAWATWAQRLADTVIYTYCAGRGKWLTTPLSCCLAPVLMAGYGLDVIFGKRGDTLDNILVARKR